MARGRLELGGGEGALDRNGLVASLALKCETQREEILRLQGSLEGATPGGEGGEASRELVGWSGEAWLSVVERKRLQLSHREAETELEYLRRELRRVTEESAEAEAIEKPPLEMRLSTLRLPEIRRA